MASRWFICYLDGYPRKGEFLVLPSLLKPCLILILNLKHKTQQSMTYIPADAKPRERFEGLLNRTVRITCNFQYKMLFRTLLITQFWWKKWLQNLLNFDKSLQIPCASDVDSTSFFNTHRRLSDPSVWKLSSTASCHYGTHNAIASNAGTAWHLCSALLLSANC